MSLGSEVAGWPRRVTCPPAVVRDYAVRWDKLLRYGFVPGIRINDGFVLRARRENGFAYRALNDGQLSVVEPVWPVHPGAIIRCGSVDLECIGPNGGFDTIVQSAWLSDQPSRVTFSNPVTIGLVTVSFAATSIAVGDSFAIYNDIVSASGRHERRTFIVTVKEE